MYRCELDHKEGWAPKDWCYRIVVLENLLRVPWTARRSNQSVLKEINPEYSLNIHWSWSSNTWPPDLKRGFLGKDPDAGKDWGQEEKETREDEIVGWHHRLNGHGFEQTLGDSEGKETLVYCSPLGLQRVRQDLETEQHKHKNFFPLFDMFDSLQFWPQISPY